MVFNIMSKYKHYLQNKISSNEINAIKSKKKNAD